MRLLGGILVCWHLALAQPASRNLGTIHDDASSGGRVHAVAFGDWGYGGTGSGLKAVSDAVAKIHASDPFHLGFTLGDNFYPSGVRSVNDRRWKQLWEPFYGKLGIPFFAALGNHDYRGSVQAQIDYTRINPNWRMPFTYYTYTAGAIQFFALDTALGTSSIFWPHKPFSDEQAKWLELELSKSKAPWKVVYAHHPIYSDGHHADEARLKDNLLPLLITWRSICTWPGTSMTCKRMSAMVGISSWSGEGERIHARWRNNARNSHPGNMAFWISRLPFSRWNGKFDRQPELR